MVEKVKTNADRLLLFSKLKKKRTSKERHHFSFDSNIVHRNVDEKENIAFPLLADILTLTSKSSRKLLSFYLTLSSISSLHKRMNGHTFLLMLFDSTSTNSTLNYIFLIHDNAQSRTMNCQILVMTFK